FQAYDATLTQLRAHEVADRLCVTTELENRGILRANHDEPAVEVPERHFHAGGGAPHGLRLGARRGQLLAKRHVPRGARQALAHVQLVGRMDIVAIADVDGHREPGIPTPDPRAPLRAAHPPPATIYRRGRERI